MTFQKGHTAWNRGKKCPQLATMKGKHHSEETKEKIRQGNLGKKVSQEGRKNIRLAKIGNKNPMYGKVSKGAFKKGHKTWNKGKKGLQVAWNKGKECPQISRTHKKKGIKPPYLSGILAQQNRKEPTSIEKKVYRELKRRGLLFETQKLINGRFIVDAYIPSLNLIVEADGNYWHSLPRTAKKDKAENAYLTKCGFNLLRLTETEINNGGFKKKLERSID